MEQEGEEVEWERGGSEEEEDGEIKEVKDLALAVRMIGEKKRKEREQRERHMTEWQEEKKGRGKGR